MPEDDAGRPARANCRRYNPGHMPHFIQVRLARQSPPSDWQRVEVLGTDGDIVVLAIEGGIRRYRNHDTAVLDWVVTRVGSDALLNVSNHALFCLPGADGGSAVFSLQDADDEPRPCRPLDDEPEQCGG